MDITMDNNKPSEIDNVTMNQALISNANTDMKHEMDETNNIFGVTGDHLHHVNDKLNNIIDVNNLDNPINLIENKTCLENDGDMGPETSVDTTDDADNDTDPLECSTLSHSKETLPSSDYPFDNKFTAHCLDLDELQLQDKAPSLSSPNTDIPFDTHVHDLHEDQNINFEDMSHNGMGGERNAFTRKHDDLHVGEDDFKTDAGTHEIKETRTVCYEYSIDGMTDQLGNANNQVIEQMKSLNIGWGTPEEPQTKGDLAYNQFEEFIEQPHEKKTTDELEQEHLEGHKDEVLECPNMKALFDDVNKGLSTVLETPTSISPGSEKDFNSFVPYQETHGQDLDSQQYDRHNEMFDNLEEGNRLTPHDNDLDDFSEQEKHLDESPEYEKHSDLLEHDKNLNEFAVHNSLKEELITEEKHLEAVSEPYTHVGLEKHEEELEEHQSLKEELQMEEKYFEDMFEQDRHENVAADQLETMNHQQEQIDNTKFNENHSAELAQPVKQGTEFDEQENYISERNEEMKHTTEFSETTATQAFEIQTGESLHPEEQLNAFNEDEKDLNDLNEFEKHDDGPPKYEKDDEFDSMIFKDDRIDSPAIHEHELDSHIETTDVDHKPENIRSLAENAMKYEEEPDVEKKEMFETVEKVEAVYLEQHPVEDFKTDLHEGFEENDWEIIANQTNEIAIESKTQHLDESHDELLQMTEKISEQPLSNTTNDDTIPVLEPHVEEVAQIEMVPSLEHEEAHIEPSDAFKDESKVDKEDINETISKESELTIDQKSCDESLDEWNSTNGKVVEEELSGSEAHKPEEETVQKIESQQSEELNINEAEEAEKTSGSSAAVEQTEEKADKDISDNLDQEVDNMSSPLNPEAKEFVPSSSPISFEKRPSDEFDNDTPSSPFAIDSELVAIKKDFQFESAASPEMPDLSIVAGIPPHVVSCMNGDDLVAQSPQKGATSVIDFQVPSPIEFASEVASRPSELSALEAPQNINLKESMHEPEKELSSPLKNNDSSINDMSGIKSPVDATLGKIEDIMNSVQMLPVDDDLEEENKSNTSMQPDVTLNGEVPMFANLSNLKLEEPKPVSEAPVAKSKVEKAAKTPEIKKTDVKSKTSTTGPKKTISSTSATISDSTKTKTATTTSKTKVSAGLTARPRTAPAPSSKPASTEKKSSTNVISARAKPEAKAPPVGLKKLPLTKPKTEDNKGSGTVRQVTSKVASTTRNAATTTRTSSTTSTTTAIAKRTTLTTTSSTAAKSQAGPRSALSPITKTSTVTSTHKPAISPRSTVTSTLRKTEAKSPTSATKPAAARTSTASANSTATKTASRASGGTSTITKTTTTTTKKLTPTTASKPAAGATAAKKPIGVKKPVGTTTTTAAKLKAAASPIRAPAASDTSEIKMNGTAPAVVTTNGNGVAEE